MRAFLVAAVLAAAPFCGASAATFSTFTGDAVFNDRCAASSGFPTATTGANIGGGNQACEIAVGEFRTGNRATNGDHERGINVPRVNGTTFNGFQGSTGQTAITNPFTSSFIFGHDGDEVLTLNLGGSFDPLTGAITGGSTLTADLAALRVGNATIRSMDEVTSLFLRTNFNQRTTGANAYAGFASLTGMSIFDASLVETALPDNVPAAAGSANAAYVEIGGIDFSDIWYLVGTTTFSWTGPGNPNGSNLNHNFKLTDLHADVPLPGAGWLLLGGLGVGYLTARRRRTAA